MLYSGHDIRFHPVSNNDGFVKSSTAIRHAVRQAHGPEQSRRTHGPEHSRRAALRCILRHCSALISTPHSSGGVRLEFGAFCFAVPFLTFHEFVDNGRLCCVNVQFPQGLARNEGICLASYKACSLLTQDERTGVRWAFHNCPQKTRGAMEHQVHREKGRIT
jgi:hypothetical protein